MAKETLGPYLAGSPRHRIGLRKNPPMPIRLCLEPRCHSPATYRGRCASHSREHERHTHGNKAIYNSKRWQMLRRKRLFVDPLCPCGHIATDVDHIHPIEQGGLPFSMANTQSLCAQCHGRKTRAEQQGQRA